MIPGFWDALVNADACQADSTCRRAIDKYYDISAKMGSDFEISYGSYIVRLTGDGIFRFPFDTNVNQQDLVIVACDRQGAELYEFYMSEFDDRVEMVCFRVLSPGIQ